MDLGALCTAAGRVGLTVREFVSADRASAQEALIGCGAFSPEEVRVALEMVDDGLRGDYSLLAVERDGKFCGYACAGKASFTASAWYLYWICIERDLQGSGAGRMLLAGVEESVRKFGGDRLVVETSGRSDYERARGFYRNAGFAEVGRIPDFYKRGDDCVVLCKLLGTSEASE
jgi:ribosomal protein S18 acetylase RimI-like enzyme